MSSHSFSMAADTLRQGGDEGMDAVHARFARRLTALVQSQLRTQFQARMDADDVVQSVFRSFIRRNQADAFEFEDWDGMWALLAQITVRKCHRVRTRHLAQRRDIRRDASLPTELAAEIVQPWISREPDPAEVLVLRELLGRVLLQLPAEKRDWFVMRLQGYSVAEISQQVGRTERAVYRLLDRARQLIVSLGRDETA